MGSPRFDVFLSHNSTDKPAVEYLAERLRGLGMEPWLDKWQLVPGAVWQDGLAEGLAASRSCAVFVGPVGWGPWQKEEMRAAIDRRVRDTAGGFRVIPVLLPGAQQPPDAQLPMFLLLRYSKETADVSVRRALLLALGELESEPGAAGEAEGLLETLLELHRGDSDPGVHSAAEWALRQWGHHEAARTAIAELVADRPADGFHWHVTPGGHTMSLLRVELSATGTSGSGRAGATAQTVGVAATPVTVEQFIRFHPEHKCDESVSPELCCPVNAVTWYDAVAYCNWLSQCEGIPQDQWRYLPNDAGEYAAGMTILPDAVRRAGYRLPSEREWEYACRAAADTEYCFGNAEEMLSGYACYEENSGGRMFEVGSLKPNDFGLYDMHGNTWEWCQSRWDPPRGGAENDRQSENVSDSDGRVLRGGSFGTDRSFVRCAARFYDLPSNHWVACGFRVARTYP